MGSNGPKKPRPTQKRTHLLLLPVVPCCHMERSVVELLKALRTMSRVFVSRLPRMLPWTFISCTDMKLLLTSRMPSLINDTPVFILAGSPALKLGDAHTELVACQFYKGLVLTCGLLLSCFQGRLAPGAAKVIASEHRGAGVAPCSVGDARHASLVTMKVDMLNPDEEGLGFRSGHDDELSARVRDAYH